MSQQQQQQGFQPNTVAVDKDIEPIDVRTLAEIEFETREYGEYSKQKLPELPIGLFMGGKRYTEYTLNPGVNTGDFDLFLGQLDPRGGEDVKKSVDTLSLFLGGGKTKKGALHAGAVESIGGMPIAQAARAAGFQTPKELISGMYMPDVCTMIFGCRLITSGFDLAVDRTCEQPGCNQRCQSIEDLSSLPCRYIPNIEGKPTFKVLLEDGFMDEGVLVKEIHFEPMRLHQLNLFYQNGVLVDIEILKACVTAIPGAPSYAEKTGRSVFDMNAYRKMTSDDIQKVKQAISDLIGVGPKNTIDVSCDCQQIQMMQPLPWARGTRQFLYNSKHLTEN